MAVKDTEHHYRAIVNSLRATLGHLDRLEPGSMAALHVQWAIERIEQDHPHLKPASAPEEC